MQCVELRLVIDVAVCSLTHQSDASAAVSAICSLAGSLRKLCGGVGGVRGTTPSHLEL